MLFSSGAAGGVGPRSLFDGTNSRSGLMVVSDSVPNWSVVLTVRRVCLVDWRNEYATRCVVESLTREPSWLAGVQRARGLSDVAVTSSKSSTRWTPRPALSAVAWTL